MTDNYQRSVTIAGKDLMWIEEMAERMSLEPYGSDAQKTYAVQVAFELLYHLRKPDGRVD